MKARFGKLSIGCFIIFPISIFLLTAIKGDEDLSQMVVLRILSFLPWAGIILAFIGDAKREEPRVYCIIGFILNLLLSGVVGALGLWAGSQFLIPHS